MCSCCRPFCKAINFLSQTRTNDIPLKYVASPVATLAVRLLLLLFNSSRSHPGFSPFGGSVRPSSARFFDRQLPVAADSRTGHQLTGPRRTSRHISRAYGDL
ncbi:hypothetical protein ACI65C_002449 [Semiaphis heraclei]